MPHPASSAPSAPRSLAETFREAVARCATAGSTADFSEVARLAQQLGPDGVREAVRPLNMHHRGTGNRTCATCFVEACYVRREALEEETLDVGPVDLLGMVPWDEIVERCVECAWLVLLEELEGRVPRPADDGGNARLSGPVTTFEGAGLDVLAEAIGRGSTADWQSLYALAAVTPSFRETLRGTLRLVDPARRASRDIWRTILDHLDHPAAPAPESAAGS